jgi:hypothetical protein
MDYLIKKSDGTAESLGGTVGKVKLPEQTGGDVTFVKGMARPVDLGDYVLVEAVEVKEPLDETTKRGETTTVVDGDVVTVTVTRTAVAKTPEELWGEVRAKRDAILRDSDFTQLDDSPKDKQAWKVYRQALRDITDQLDPGGVTWPTEPA